MKFATDIQGPWRISFNDGDPMTSHVAPSSDQILHLSNTLFYNQTPAKMNDTGFSAN